MAGGGMGMVGSRIRLTEWKSVPYYAKEWGIHQIINEIGWKRPGGKGNLTLQGH
jgi:hypothetical protein